MTNRLLQIVERKKNGDAVSQEESGDIKALIYSLKEHFPAEFAEATLELTDEVQVQKNRVSERDKIIAEKDKQITNQTIELTDLRQYKQRREADELKKKLEDQLRMQRIEDERKARSMFPDPYLDKYGYPHKKW